MKKAVKIILWSVPGLALLLAAGSLFVYKIQNGFP
jgi:cytochrome c-type biogenesis protein CcmH/NrfF